MRVWLLGILSFTVLVAYLDRVNVSVLIAFPRFLAEMGLRNNPVGQGLLMTFFLVAYGLGNILLGPVGDRLGPRKTMCVALVSWTVPLVVAATARTVTVLYAAMLVLGVGEALHYPMLIAFVKNWFPRAERGKANSSWLLGQMIGPALGMACFAMVIASYGWRSIYWLCATLSLLSIPLVWFFTTDRPEQHRRINRAELEHITRGKRQEAAKGKKRVQSGNAWRSFVGLIKNPDFCCSAFAFCASASMWWGIMSWLPQYLRVARGFTWAKMGFFSSLPYLFGLLGLISAGVVADRMKRAAPLNCIGLAGCALFLGLGAIVHNGYLSACLLCVALFFKGVSIPMAWTVLQAFIPANMMGQAAGLQNGSAQLVGSLSPMIVGFLTGATGAYTAGLMYLVAFGLLGAACGFYLVLRKY
ncbi:MAG TPA: MFS transporter [Terriglobales bacterium]|nr:MFS transporter [Terriglobales bacterium]